MALGFSPTSFGQNTFHFPQDPLLTRTSKAFDNGSLTANERLILDKMWDGDQAFQTQLAANGMSKLESAAVAMRRGRYEATLALFERVDIPAGNTTNRADLDRLRGYDAQRQSVARGQLASGVQGGNINIQEFQQLNNYSRSTEQMRARMLEGGYTSQERAVIETRLRRYNEMTEAFGSESNPATGRVDQRTEQLFGRAQHFTGQVALAQDLKTAYGAGVVARNGNVLSDERESVRTYFQQRDQRPESKTVDPRPFSVSSSPQVAPRRDLNAVQTQLARYDSDGDGRVTRRELANAMADPAIKGEQARVLATSFAAFDSLGSDAPTSFFGNLGGPSNAARAISLMDLDPCLKTSREYRQKLAAFNGMEATIAERGSVDSSTSLFGPEGKPDPLSIKQGLEGDCWFLAALSGMKSEQIQSMVKPGRDGGFEVSFPGAPPVQVGEPTEAERMVYAQGNGSWITVMEKAAEKLAGQGALGPDRTVRGIQGGFSTQANRLLFGSPGKHYLTDGGVTQPLEHRAATNLENPAQLATLLETSLSGGQVVTAYGAAGGSDPSSPAFSADYHVYTVLGYDKETGMVTVRNPWGQNERADRDGVNDGTFEMPLKHFHSASPVVIVSDPPLAGQR